MNEKPRSADQRLRRRRTLHDDFAGWMRKNRSRLPMRLLVRQRRGDGGRDYRFPDAPLPPGRTPDEELRALVRAGARERVTDL